jgi:hypothetical protein
MSLLREVAPKGAPTAVGHLGEVARSTRSQVGAPAFNGCGQRDPPFLIRATRRDPARFQLQRGDANF